jgi:hypothetical protein
MKNEFNIVSFAKTLEIAENIIAGRKIQSLDGSKSEFKIESLDNIFVVKVKTVLTAELQKEVNNR